MSLTNKGLLEAGQNMLIFPALSSPLLFHGVFNRLGGASLPPWNTRNVSFGLGDKPEHVRLNRESIKKTLDCDQLVSAGQVHGSKVYLVEKKPEDDLEIAGFDALITNIRGVGLMIQQADCQAVMLFDPEKKAVGIAHAGWRGSVAEIIARTVSAMNQSFATRGNDLLAVISPSLGPCCAEFVNYRRELPVSFHDYQVRPNFFDFWSISHDQLCSAGIKPENIHKAGVCTRCSQDYFSYRRDKITGRFASVIGLK